MNRNIASSPIVQFIKGLIIKRSPIVFIAFAIFASPSLNAANPNTDNRSSPPAAATTSNSMFSPEGENADQARKREAMEKAMLHEKLKMRTQTRDANNERRAAGEILGFDVLIGAFLTLLWSMISLFIATRFAPESKERGQTRSGLRLYYSVAALVPLLLLWVSISTGYLSWWLTLAVSLILYWLSGQIFRKITAARATHS